MPLFSHLALIVRSQLPALIQVLIASLLAHNLTQNDYGTFNLLKNIVIMGYSFVGFSFERTALNLEKNYSLKTITNGIIPIRIILFAVLATLIFYYTVKLRVVPTLTVLTIICVVPAIFDIKYCFDVKQSVQKDVSIAIFRAAPLLALIPLLWLIDSGSNILIAHFSLLLTGYFLYVFLQHRYVQNLLGKLDFTHVKKFFLLGVFTFLGAVAASLNLYLPTVIIEAKSGLSSLATYSVALTIFIGFQSVFTLIVRISVSEYLKTTQAVIELSKCLKTILPLWLAVTAVCLIYGKPIIGFVFGETYIAAYGSMIILLAGLLTAPISIYFNSILIVKGFTRLFMLIRLGGLTVNVLTTSILIDGMGVSGAAIGMFLSLFFMALASTYTCYRLSYIN